MLKFIRHPLKTLSELNKRLYESFKGYYAAIVVAGAVVAVIKWLGIDLPKLDFDNSWLRPNQAAYLESLSRWFPVVVFCAAVLVAVHKCAWLNRLIHDYQLPATTNSAKASPASSQGHRRLFPLRLNTAICRAYEESKVEGLLVLQQLLRALFVAFLILNAIHSLSLRDVEGSIHGNSWIILGNHVQIFLGTCYLIWSYSRQKSEVAQIPSSELRINLSIFYRLFSRSSLGDCVMITAISSSSLLAETQYSMAFLIPLLGTWLFSEPRMSMRVFIYIAIGLTIDSLVFTQILFNDINLARHLGHELIPNVPPALRYTMLLLGDLLPRLMFWGVMALLLALLRFLRGKEHERAEMLRAITDNIEHEIFAKDADRRFKYASRPMLKRLNLQIHQVLNRTDKDLGIDRPEYEKSDLAVINSPSRQNDFLETLEPNYLQSPDSTPMIWTKKKALWHPKGRVIGLVGICEPGTPFHIAATTQKLLDKLPFFVTMKDRAGRIVWANERYCKAVEHLLPQVEDTRDQTNLLFRLRSMHLKTGGPTDRDFYEEHYAQKFKSDDDRVIDLAQNALSLEYETGDTSFDPIEVLNSEALTPLEGWPEYHQIKGRPGEWVRVVKLPWWNRATGEVKGVIVLFVDIHASHCRKGIVWRWCDKHNMALIKLLLTHSPGGTSDSAANVEPLDAALIGKAMLMQSRMLMWMKNFIDHRASASGSLVHQPSHEKRNIDDLGTLLGVAERLYPTVTFEFIRSSFLYEAAQGYDEIEAIVWSLLVNAADACVKAQGSSRTDASRVSVEVVARHHKGRHCIGINVRDNGIGIEPLRIPEIMEGRSLNSDGFPGGGIFLCTQLIAQLAGHVELSLDSEGIGKGCLATLWIPMSRKDTYQQSRTHLSTTSKN